MNVKRKLNRRLFGFHFSEAASIEDVVEDIFKNTSEGARFLITPNASHCLYYSEAQHQQLLDFYKDASIVLPDGMPVVWLGNLKGLRLHRLPGSDLFPALWQEIKAREKACVFVLARPELAEKLGAEYDHSRFIVPPMFEASDEKILRQIAEEVVEKLKESNAEFVFLGLTFPKQELLGIEIANLLRNGSKQNVLILQLGASFEFYLNLKTRAPQWMQRTGFEWLYRFMKEPRRLWKRYTVDNFRFLILAAKEYFKN